ncbi:type I-F CRISPR-associated endoribonuclease Cas6/Csy4 [Rheinheimera sp. UJ63]|uniref:type I-F CRISPR-associated endoribonuclease Cas6/Csy4 n=1 Tax=Rheinheimera sp. UJ63 TaxID=2910157 RepID=UPI001F25A7AB|nr:type I-F CRISPR-associated endoribonuclease Cas6/Csy4 [Rheinheimera sp. UJ63]MCF4010654.1 type I-F CRISPR-associated endoribonuclease Cas6/Csy4 [Rheinheimera sp. UJ63]
MDSYIEITVKPEPEISTNIIMGTLCSKLHSVLGQVTHGQVGVSFPEYGKTLGTKLRLHGSADALEKLMEKNWMFGLDSYCRTTKVLNTPANSQYCYFNRVQTKSAENKRNRIVKRHLMSQEEAQAKFTESHEVILKHPFFQTSSKSSKQYMKIFVERGPLVDKPTIGSFNSYGLSRRDEKITVPWF